MSVYRVQIAKRGVVTLPAEVRKERHLQEGQMMTLLDLGGVFVLAPKELETDRMANRLAEKWQQQGESLETLLKTLREVREEYASGR
ncbi:MAG: AbrB/MazE/SpoVT family DNA-binding domain-containing protein [Candidatus Methanomethyliaceae archaeon]